MDNLPSDVLFSRQGKATTHMYTEFSKGPKKRPPPKTFEPVKLSDLKSMLHDLEKNRLEEENQAKNKPKPLTSSFRAISRDSYSFAFRNRTDSPKVGNYSPRFAVVEPRATHTYKLVNHTSVPKERVVFVPSCFDHLSCSFPNRKTEDINKHTKRNTLSLTQYNNFIEEKQKTDTTIPKKVTERLILPLAFDIQRPRQEFVKESDPPNEKRFDYIDNNSPISTKHSKVPSLPFSKFLPRKELFEEKLSLPPYEANKEVTQRRLSTSILNFSKMTSRKPLVLEHMLKTPAALENEKIQTAYSFQSTVRG